MPNALEIVLKAKDETGAAVKSVTGGIDEIKGRIGELKKIQQDAAKTMLTAPDMSAYTASSEDFKKVTQDLKLANKELKDVTDALGDSQDRAATSTTGLFKSFTLATLAANAIQAGIQAANQAIRDGITDAANLQRSIMGLESAAHSFGVSTGAMNSAVTTLTADGLLTFSQVANGIKNLLAAGMDIDTAVALMQRFKDEASFGRAETIKYGDAVVNLSEAFMTGSSQMGNLNGHTANFSDALEIGAAALGKTTAQLTAAETEQAKLIGYMQQGAYTAGNAAQYADTYAGSLSRMETESEKASASLGQALLPATEYLNQGFASFLAGVNSTSGGVQELQSYLVTLAAIVRTAAQTVVGSAQVMYGALKSVATLSWDPLLEGVDQAAVGFIDTWQDAYAQYEKIYGEGNEAQVGEYGNALKDMVDLNQGAQSKIQQQIDDANRSFARSMEQRSRQFAESLRDMVITHRDKSRSIQADIDKENAAYQASTLKRNQAFEEDIASLEENHLEKVADIEAQIAEEREKGIEVDGVLYAEANQKKIAKLEEQLRKEQETYQRAIDQRKAQYAEDIAESAAAHNEKLAELQRNVDEEMVILERHRAEVAAVGEAQKQDDITRLKEQFALANREAERNHQEQLARIRQQGAAQGVAYGGAVAQGIANTRQQVNATSQGVVNEANARMAEGGRVSAQALWNNFKKGIQDAFRDWPNTLRNALHIPGMTSLLSGIPVVGGAASALKLLSNFIGGRASGGPVQAGRPYWVGENKDGSLNATSELMVPGQSGTVYTQEQLRSMLGNQGPMKQVAVTIGNVVLQNQTDMDAFLGSLSWQIR